MPVSLAGVQNVMTENTKSETGTGARPRNSETSKKAILWAAQEALSRKSYDEVGLREIAHEAKIDPALIIRYFGSKEGLFREVIRTHIHLESLKGTPISEYPERLVRLVLGDTHESDPRSLLILHLSAPSAVAGPIIRETLREQLVTPMVEQLGGTDAEIRVESLLALLGGLSTGRHVTCYPSLVEGDREKLVRLMTPAFRHLLFGDLG